MLITSSRHTFTDTSTIGIVRAPSYIACSLEDCDRFLEAGGSKIQGKTCIPRGKYEVVISFSNRFKKLMMELKDVPGFSGVRIHAGNTSENTEGCILLGEYSDDNKIVNSAKAVRDLFLIVDESLKKEKVFIEIT